MHTIKSAFIAFACKNTILITWCRFSLGGSFHRWREYSIAVACCCITNHRDGETDMTHQITGAGCYHHHPPMVWMMGIRFGDLHSDAFTFWLRRSTHSPLRGCVPSQIVWCDGGRTEELKHFAGTECGEALWLRSQLCGWFLISKGWERSASVDFLEDLWFLIEVVGFLWLMYGGDKSW